MSAFKTPLRVTPLDDGRMWQLLEGFEYETEGDLDEYGRGNPAKVGTFLIVVPKGFITDFASVPRALWWLLPPWGTYGKPAVIHDFLYHERIWTRLRCDQIFLEAMKTVGVSHRTRILMYEGVRAFGWLAWWHIGKLIAGGISLGGPSPKMQRKKDA